MPMLMRRQKGRAGGVLGCLCAVPGALIADAARDIQVAPGLPVHGANLFHFRRRLRAVQLVAGQLVGDVLVAAEKLAQHMAELFARVEILAIEGLRAHDIAPRRGLHGFSKRPAAIPVLLRLPARAVQQHRQRGQEHKGVPRVIEPVVGQAHGEDGREEKQGVFGPDQAPERVLPLVGAFVGSRKQSGKGQIQLREFMLEAVACILAQYPLQHKRDNAPSPAPASLTSGLGEWLYHLLPWIRVLDVLVEERAL